MEGDIGEERGRGESERKILMEEESRKARRGERRWKSKHNYKYRIRCSTVIFNFDQFDIFDLLGSKHYVIPASLSGRGGTLAVQAKGNTTRKHPKT